MLTCDKIRLITSQNATAPKLQEFPDYETKRLITSQNATAPKPIDRQPKYRPGLITSQNATAPKLRSAGRRFGGV